MEGMPAHNRRNEQYAESDADFAPTYERAVVEAQTNATVAELLAPVEHAGALERIAHIDTLVEEMAATEEGSNIPLNNGHRHTVEALCACKSDELKKMSPRELAQYEYARLAQALNLDVVN